MEQTRRAWSFWVFARDPTLILFNLPNFFLRFIIGMLLVRAGNKSFEEMMNRYNTETLDLIDDKTKSSMLVRLFNWLEQHPVSNTTIKKSAFVIFLVSSLLEIFTT